MTIQRSGSLDQALNRLLVKNDQHVSCGIQDGSFDAKGKSNAVKAFMNEYGTKTIPPRPAMRSTVSNYKGEWVALAKDAIKAGYTLEKMLYLVGTKMQSDMVATYTTWTTPPNAPYTIAKKGFDKPLDDTGAMINAISFELKDGKL